MHGPSRFPGLWAERRCTSLPWCQMDLPKAPSTSSHPCWAFMAPFCPQDKTQTLLLTWPKKQQHLDDGSMQPLSTPFPPGFSTLTHGKLLAGLPTPWSLCSECWTLLSTRKVFPTSGPPSFSCHISPYLQGQHLSPDITVCLLDCHPPPGGLPKNKACCLSAV